MLSKSEVLPIMVACPRYFQSARFGRAGASRPSLPLQFYLLWFPIKLLSSAALIPSFKSSDQPAASGFEVTHPALTGQSTLLSPAELLPATLHRRSSLFLGRACSGVHDRSDGCDIRERPLWRRLLRFTRVPKPIDETGIKLAPPKLFAANDSPKEGHRRANAFDCILVEHSRQPIYRAFPGLGPDAKLGEKRIIKDWHLPALVTAAVVANARTLG